MTSPERGTVVTRHLPVTRTARYALLGEGVARPREVWFVLHGFRQLAGRFLSRFAHLDDGSRLIVAPEGLNRFYLDDVPGRHGPDARVGATWMTREDREAEIADYVAYLDRLRGVVTESLDGTPRVGVLGFSQGVHTAARWVTLGESPVPARTVLWAAYLPPDLDMEAAARRLGSTRLVLVRGDDDEHRNDRLERDELDRLAQAEIPYEIRRHPGGHRLDGDLLAELLDLSGGPAQNSPTNPISGTSS